jgi:L-fuculose-phosphate aldolase
VTGFWEERARVLEAVRRIVALGLVSGASGNVSMRLSAQGRELFAVTASRVPYARFGIDDVVVVDLDIEPVYGEGIPSSESLTHAAVYRARPDVGAVIHTHPVYATAFAVAGRPIPPIVDEQVVLLGGAVGVAAYSASASEELAKNVVAALGDRAAVLLRSHGCVGVGADLGEAVAVVELVERIACIHVAASALGGVQELPEEVVRTEAQVYRMMRGIRGE